MKKLRQRKLTHDQIENMPSVLEADKKYKDSDRIYYYSWNVGRPGPCVGCTFGFHGTEAHWAAYQVLCPDNRTNIKRRFLCTGKQHKLWSRKAVQQAHALLPSLH